MADPAQPPEAGGPAQPAGTIPTVRLGDRFEIIPGSPLPALDSAAGPAFGARSLRGRKGGCYAVIAAGQVPPRVETLQTFIGLDATCQVVLVDHGAVVWSAAGARRMAYVFERPGGRPLMSSLTDPVPPYPDEVLIKIVIRPLVAAIRDLAVRGVTHGNIRPTNVFFRDTEASSVMLGQCASAPPGFGQPVLFETIERAMAPPAGRGAGTLADDLFALGMTILMLALGRNPVPEITDDALLDARMERGTYPAVAGSHRLSSALAEPVRGLLIDEPKNRWGLQQLDLWLDGRRLTPKQVVLPKRATRPFELAGREAWNSRALARILPLHPGQAAHALESGEIDRWLRRGLGDDLKADAVNTVVQAALAGNGGHGVGPAERLLAKIGIVLDPAAPIRLKGRAMMPDAIGLVLAEAVLRDQSYQQVVEAVLGQLPALWNQAQADPRPDLTPTVQLLDSLRAVLDRAVPGFGVERLLYETNRSLPCLSPMVRDRCALGPGDVLLALDALPGTRDRGREPIDRHIAAFLAARHRRLDEAVLMQLAPTGDPVRRMIASLMILSDVQQRTINAPVRQLCRWIVPLLEPAIARFHHRPHRQTVRQQLEEAADKGMLAALLSLVDDSAALKSDLAGLAAARRECRATQREIEQLRRMINDRQGIIATTGRQAAALISGLVACLVIAGVVLNYLTSRG